MAKSPQELYQEREKRFNDAVALRKPDRVPIAFFAAFFVTEQAGLTKEEAMYEPEKTAQAWKEVLPQYQWDMVPSLGTMHPGSAMETLGIKQYHWPGFDLADHLPYQFVEDEYMLAEEYDELLANPGDFMVRKMWPRFAKVFEPLGKLPPLHWLWGGSGLIRLGMALAGIPPVMHMLSTVQEAAQEATQTFAIHTQATKDLAEMGFPPLYGGVCQSPFDVISDYLRGMRGTMLDMYRCPDKLLAAIDFFTPAQIQSAIMACKMANCPRVFIPLHRGAAGFMSNDQFAKFYWPSIKAVIEGIIDAGLTPMPFWEGDYTPRLEFLAELPKGKVASWFDTVDVQKAKEIIGDNLCFYGNVPAQLLVTGTPEEVKDYVKMLIDTFGDTGGLIINGSVDGVPNEAKHENVMAVTEVVHEYGVY